MKDNAWTTPAWLLLACLVVTYLVFSGINFMLLHSLHQKKIAMNELTAENEGDNQLKGAKENTNSNEHTFESGEETQERAYAAIQSHPWSEITSAPNFQYDIGSGCTGPEKVVGVADDGTLYCENVTLPVR